MTTLRELDGALTPFPVTLERAALRRFKAELRALVELRPIAGLVPTVGGGIDADGHPYVERAPGARARDLGARVPADGPLDLDEAVVATTTVLAALAALDAGGLLHGAVRPAAVVLGRDGPALADPVPLVVAERLGGALAPAFAAPEVLQGEPPTAASDVFSAAVTLVHLATGRAPWSDGDADADTVLLRILSGSPPDLGLVNTRPELAGAVRRALAVDPVRRPSARALGAALERGGPGGGRGPDQLDTLPPSSSPLGSGPAGPPRSPGPGAVPSPGMPVGSFCVLGEPLGRGATGTVFRATHTAAGEVAVKVLRTDLTDDPTIVDRFVSERATLKRIEHPNVVRVLDLVTEGATVAIVMELVHGPDLRRWLRNAPPLPPAAVCGLLAQLAEALDAVHGVGVVHRDLKPENVLLERVGTADIAVRLTDFGIAYSARDTRRLTGHGQIVGTPDYLAPEVSAGGTAGPPADVYAFGVVAYELLAGCRPFATPDALGRLLLPPAERAPVPRPPGLDDRLWDVVARCLTDDPAARPTAAALAVALSDRARSIGDGAPPLDRRSAPLPAPPRRETDGQVTELGRPLPTRPPAGPPDAAGRRRLLRWGGAAALVALLAGVAVGVLTGGDDGQREPTTTDPQESLRPVYLTPRIERRDAHTIQLVFEPVEGAIEYQAVRDPNGQHDIIETQSPSGGAFVTLPDEQNERDHCYVIQAIVLEEVAASTTTTTPSPLGPTPACTDDQ